jgi:hypothetical protein
MRNVLFVLSLFAAVMATADAHAQTVQVWCDQLCWNKAPNVAAPGQMLICLAKVQTEEELQHYKTTLRSTKNQTANVISEDVNRSAISCPLVQHKEFGAQRDFQTLPVSGSAYNAKICGLTLAEKVGDVMSVLVCGLSNDGKSTNFFPAP